MKPLLALLILGLATTAGLTYFAVRWGDCALADLNGDPSVPRPGCAGNHHVAAGRTHR